MKSLLLPQSPRPLTRRRLLSGAVGVAAGLMASTRLAPAIVRIEVGEGNIQPVPIALPDFLGGTPGDSEAGRSVTQVMTNDLKRSGLFAPIDPAAFIEKITNSDTVPRYPDWRAIRRRPSCRTRRRPRRAADLGNVTRQNAR